MGWVISNYGIERLRNYCLTKFIKDATLDETMLHGGYRLGRDKGESCMIDSPMCFKQGDLLYPGPDDFK